MIRWVVRCLLLCCLAQAGTLSAHEVGLSQSRWRMSGDELVAEIGFAPRELVALRAVADRDGDGELSSVEFAAHEPELRDALLAGITIEREGRPCAPTEVDLEWRADDAVLLRLRAPCAGDGTVGVSLPLLGKLSLEHRQWATLVLADGERGLLLSAREQRFELAADALAQPWWAVLWLGAEHILFGLDHLAFLLGLLLAGPALRRLLLTLTAFTVAHSLTLGLMAAGLVHAPGALVEPLIGLSVAVVAIDNLRPRSVRIGTRWLLVLAFGLIHGFGFAGAIADRAPSGNALWTWLLAFNLGVELGQVAFAWVVLATGSWLKRLRWDARFLQWAGNATLLLLGAGWTLTRI
ncbi:MAG: hypothetical protein OMOMHJEC_01936 [Xanthomonadales bacterium]|nr:hypothetical protein [Xanthomonadales bacterium]